MLYSRDVFNGVPDSANPPVGIATEMGRDAIGFCPRSCYDLHRDGSQANAILDEAVQ
jgi:hypothetical protein